MPLFLGKSQVRGGGGDCTLHNYIEFNSFLLLLLLVELLLLISPLREMKRGVAAAVPKAE